MKNLFLSLILILITASFTFAQSWSSVQYDYSNGPVSPEYQKNYTIMVNSDRTVTLTPNNVNARADQSYSKRLSKKQMSSFNKFLNSTGFLNAGYNPNFMDKMKIGGPTKKIIINFSNNQATVNLNESLGDKTDLANFEALTARMESLIPAKVLKKVSDVIIKNDHTRKANLDVQE